MNNKIRLFPLARTLLTGALFTAGWVQAQDGSAFLGRWALTTPDKQAGWLEIKQENGWCDGSILWMWGSVVPVADVVVDGPTLTVTRVSDVPRKDEANRVVRTQQLTEIITAQVTGDAMNLTRTVPRKDGSGFDRSQFTGRRIPALPPAPDLAKVRFGDPITLLGGRDFTGWRVLESDRMNCWSMEEGVLVNRPPGWPHVEGKPHPDTANLRTIREFEDFNLRLEVNPPPGCNSGVYLRGIYEVQVLDSFGQPVDSHNMGAIYSRITPTVAAEKPPGEWQTLDITLVDRHVTVILNGTKIIDNQPLQGCTGGALWSDEFRPGPIYLQGDHGPVSYRNIVLRPVVK
jgi:hypothetical protein